MTWSDYSETNTDDWRKCQVSTCHKKHTGHTTRDNRRVYSNFCAHHTCWKIYPEYDGPGYYCSVPKKSDERYCSLHLKCGEESCSRMGEWVGTAPSEDEYVQWFCRDHRCTYPDCRSRATDRQQQRCAAHFIKCAVPACTRSAYLHRDGSLDTVCAAHYSTQRCLWRDCTRHVSSHYCSAHGCRRPGCQRARGGGDGSGGHEYCIPHTCKTPGCRALARFEDTPSHCERHACAVVTCASQRLGAEAKLDVGTAAVDRNRCAAHARARERRSLRAMYGGQSTATAIGGERERERERERKRLSDDLERIRRRERELEAERARLERAREEREEAERIFARYMAKANQERW
ncbi:hypothetical protein P885DRAFT_42313 [Corynascus similis CBS 632.67]